MRRLALTALVLLLAAAAAVAGNDEVKIKKLGAAKITWNPVRYREELMQQLQPGLTWRLGKDGATRLKLTAMALTNGNSMLFPGDVTLNLRYWTQVRWDLVVFEENQWKWGPEVTELGLIPVKVGKDPDEKADAKQLTLELKATTKAEQSDVPVPAVTGMSPDLLDPDEVSDFVGYSEAAKKEFDQIPVLELHMGFGPHKGLVVFEAVKFAELRGEKSRAGEGGGRVKLRLRYARHPAPLARTELLEEHEGQITLAMWDEGAPDGKPVVLVLSGGEEPMLWPVSRGPGEGVTERVELDAIAGERKATKGKPKTLECELDANVLTVHLVGVDYIFRL